MTMQREETKEFLNDLTSRDQRMIISTITLVHTANSLEELNQQTEDIEMATRKKGVKWER